MNTLRKRQDTDSTIDSKEEQRGLLRSSKVSGRCSSLAKYPNTGDMPKEVALD